MLAVLGISTFILFTSKFGFEKWKMNIFYLLVPSPKRFLSEPSWMYISLCPYMVRSQSVMPYFESEVSCYLKFVKEEYT